MSRPERLTVIAAVVATGALATGCGKSDLVRHDSTQTSPQAAVSQAHPPKHPVAPAAVPIPRKLTAVRAAAFAKSVNLLPVDFPGSRRTPHSRNLESQKEEAADCGGSGSQTIGGGRSAKLDRGSELNTESISSSVIVLSSPQAARADLAYTNSLAGVACYGKILRKKLAGESTSGLKVGHVLVTRRSIATSQGEMARGIRITARIAGVRSGVAISLFVDAVAFTYGPVEIELYTTSFVQPVAERTEEGLLDVLQARARLGTL